MLNKNGERELAYLVQIDNITAMDADRLECAHIGGWCCVVGKGEFQIGDPAVYFEIDSKLPEVEPFASMEFLASKHFKIKSQKIRGVISQGLLMPVSAFGWVIQVDGSVWNPGAGDHGRMDIDAESRFLTKELGVTYAVMEDNFRKSNGVDKYKKMAQKHPKAARTWVWKWLWQYKWGKKILFTFFGKSKYDGAKDWPVGKFPGVSKTDQERCENLPWVLSDKTPFIRTQKCDGSSGTFILEHKGKKKFEFYVCSRNVRMASKEQECFYGKDNYYWDAAIKYNIEEKMKDYLGEHPECTFVCWQGEICAPGIQSNPHNLKELHLYLFHMTDSMNGRYDIREAAKIWKAYDMEVVPIDEELYILPDDFEEFKATADGKYDASVCEGNASCAREGYVYYKSTDPTFSFKNVSRKYLLKHGQ